MRVGLARLQDYLRSRTVIGAVLGAAAALGPAVFFRGFTVDDALISARYAAHLASGAGYRFNVGGPVTDGVTPLGWAHLLSVFAAGGPLSALGAAKWLGGAAWVLAAAALGAAITRASDRPARFAAFGLIVASAAVGAWSVAGMETGVVIALAALAAAAPELGFPWAGAVCAGLCAAWRPEMLPWAVVVGGASVFAGRPAPEGGASVFAPRPASEGGASVSAGRPAPEAGASVSAGRPAPEAGASAASALEEPASAPGSARRLWIRGAARVAVASAPFLVVAAVRWSVFGRPSPLSALAKPPDVSLGVNYALACFLLTGPVALLAPIAWARLGAYPRGLVAATFAHFMAVALVGGDWMPLSRLVVAVLPGAALAAAHIASVVDARVALLRIGIALAGQLFVFVKIGPIAARVMDDRRAVIEELREPLADARVIASLDIGWLGAASSATIVDLAGVTDPEVAALPGSHTAKQIPASLLDRREVDTLVLLLEEGEVVRAPWPRSHFARAVEARIAFIPGIADDFEPIATSTPAHVRYLVLRRTRGRVAAIGSSAGLESWP